MERLLCLIGLMLAHGSILAAEVTTGIDEQAGLKYWQVANKSMSLRLVQRLPDQTRGFFLARGFDLKQVDDIANSCVFQTVFRNTSQTGRASPLEYDLMQWKVVRTGHEQRMKTREAWETEWNQRGVSTSAKIAFKWSLLPTRQVYRPGDYNWGMSVFALQPGSVFDLHVSWAQHGKIHHAVIHKIRCAKDSDVQQSQGEQ